MARVGLYRLMRIDDQIFLVVLMCIDSVWVAPPMDGKGVQNLLWLFGPSTFTQATIVFGGAT